MDHPKIIKRVAAYATHSEIRIQMRWVSHREKKVNDHEAGLFFVLPFLHRNLFLFSRLWLARLKCSPIKMLLNFIRLLIKSTYLQSLPHCPFPPLVLRGIPNINNIFIPRILVCPVYLHSMEIRRGFQSSLPQAADNKELYVYLYSSSAPQLYY